MNAPKAKAVVEAPPGMVADRFDIDGDAFVLFEWPLPQTVVVSAPTTAEREVLRLLLEGFSNAEIAQRRGRSLRTVANQVGSIFRRLDVKSRFELFALDARSRR
jgi:DNA-binding CsgD family transcriptional regulator